MTRSGVQVGGDDEHVAQRQLDLLTRAQREIVDMVLHGRDEAIEELLGRHAFAAEVIDEEHAAVGLEMRRRLVIALRGDVDQVEQIERQFAADDDQRPADANPAVIDACRAARRVIDALVDLLVEQADHGVAHADGSTGPSNRPAGRRESAGRGCFCRSRTARRRTGCARRKPPGRPVARLSATGPGPRERRPRSPACTGGVFANCQRSIAA